MAENSNIKFLKKYLQKLKSFFLSKDILSFLLFLILSGAFWFVNALGKERETTISIPIRYVGIPQNISIVNSPPSELVLNIKDQGLRLISYSTTNLTPITIDLKRNFYEKGEILLTSDQLSSKISKYLKLQSSTVIVDVLPDSIMLKYERLSQRTLPVQLISNIEFAPQYMLIDKVEISPEVLTVFGPKRILDTLKTIPTELFEQKNISKNSTTKLKLKSIPSVRYSTSEIEVKLYVEQFTEKKVLLPITSINCPNNLVIRPFPAFVNATFTIGLSKFKKNINASDIQVYLDYNNLILDKSSKQRLIVKCNKTYISNIRIVPQEVEYILEEK